MGHTKINPKFYLRSQLIKMDAKFQRYAEYKTHSWKMHASFLVRAFISYSSIVSYSGELILTTHEGVLVKIRLICNWQSLKQNRTLFLADKWNPESSQSSSVKTGDSGSFKLISLSSSVHDFHLMVHYGCSHTSHHICILGGMGKLFGPQAKSNPSPFFHK